MRKKNITKKKSKIKKIFIPLILIIALSIPIILFALLFLDPIQIRIGNNNSTFKKTELIRNKQHYQFISFDQLLFPNQYLHTVDQSLFPDQFLNHSINHRGDSLKKTKSQINIPERIKALDGKKIAIEGYVVPLESDGKNLKSFLLVDQIVDCLFCQGIGVTQWVATTVMDPNGIYIKEDQYENPVTVYGTLEVGEEYEDGNLDSIYRMKTDGIEHRNFFFSSSF